MRVFDIMLQRKGVAEHLCRICGTTLQKRKFKLSAKVGGKSQTLFLCKKCLWATDHELSDALAEWYAAGNEVYNSAGNLKGKRKKKNEQKDS